MKRLGFKASTSSLIKRLTYRSSRVSPPENLPAAPDENEKRKPSSVLELYETLPLQPNQIRLLKIISPLDKAPVEWALEVVSLGSAPDFSTMSYVWGEPTDRESVRVNGVSVQITRSLSLALQNLVDLLRDGNDEVSRTAPSLYFWADGLCIDQSNVQERNAQVRLMGTIYSTAAASLSWLGPDFSDHVISTAFTAISKMWDQVSGLDKEDLMKFDWLRRAPELCANEGEIGYSWWDAIVRLQQAEYWKRVWIFQELILPWDVILFTSRGPAISLDKIVTVHYKLEIIRREVDVQEETDLRPKELSETVWGLFFERQGGWFGPWRPLERVANCRRRIHGTKREVFSWDDWGVVFDVACELKATDPRDLIYGLLGVVDLGLEPDYGPEKDARGLYAEVMRMYVEFCARAESHGNLVWLTRAGDVSASFALDTIAQLDGCSGANDITASLPSWAPDFSLKSRSLHVYETGAIGLQFGTANSPFEGWKHRGFPSVHGRELHVVAVEVGTIDKVLEIRLLKFPSHQERPTNGAARARVASQIRAAISALPAEHPMSITCRMLAVVLARSSPAGSDVDTERVVRAAIDEVVDFVKDKCLVLSNTDGWNGSVDQEIARQAPDMIFAFDPGTGERSRLEAVFRHALRRWRDRGIENVFFDNLFHLIIDLEAFARHRLCFFDDSSAGVAHVEALVGDRLFIIGGCAPTLILREGADGTYRLIGPCEVPPIHRGSTGGAGSEPRMIRIT